MNHFDRVIGVILGAGRGKRIQEFTNIPKILLPLKGKPLIQYGLDILARLKLKVIFVVKHRKEEIIKHCGKQYRYVEQKTHPGTGGAIRSGLYGFLKYQAEFGSRIDTILILQGDDTAFLLDETIQDLLEVHFRKNSVVSILTTKKKNPTGFGRIIRNAEGEILRVIEEKNATESQKKIKEINTGVWVFNIPWLRKHLKYIKRNAITGEYYATDLLEIAVNHGFLPNFKVCQETEFFGINTEAEYRKAIELKEQDLCQKKVS